jgi:hypothetical protein
LQKFLRPLVKRYIPGLANVKIPVSSVNSRSAYKSLCFAVTNQQFLSGETMKNLQKLCLAGVFTLLLSTTTLAGEIPTGGKTPPPPPPASASVTPSGTIAIDPRDNESDDYQFLEDIIPDLLLTLLSVF